MDESRKRRRSRDLARSEEATKRRNMMVTAMTAAVAIAVAVATGVTYMAHAPKIRQQVHEPRRLVWEEHVADLQEQNCFKRYYRMPLETFEKLVELLRPSLERNAHMASVRTKNGVITVHLRVAIAIRLLAGGNYMDIAVVFGVGISTVFSILWQVVDAINSNPAVGPFFFPQSEEECARAARRWKGLSTNGVFDGTVAAVDGLLIKCKAPTPKETANVKSYYSGSKSSYGINVQAMCDHNMRFCSLSTISPGSTNDWVAWDRSCLKDVVAKLPPGYHVIGDAAYPISDQLLTPYPGRNLQPGPDSFNFHLSQQRVKIEQSYGLVVSQWGILWRRLAIQFSARPDIITAIFHLHNYLRDEQVVGVKPHEENEETGRGRPTLTIDGRLNRSFQNPSSGPAPSRSGEAASRLALRMVLEDNKQWRPEYNRLRNS